MDLNLSLTPSYFYRVPPQELHRRSQQDPTKTKALQTVIDMKVSLTC
uniref:Uncharacterized protein n=1 Tax=Hucho hucho TaxID=62062 RepID=A0A4W5KV90_9TELE